MIVPAFAATCTMLSSRASKLGSGRRRWLFNRAQIHGYSRIGLKDSIHYRFWALEFPMIKHKISGSRNQGLKALSTIVFGPYSLP